MVDTITFRDALLWGILWAVAQNWPNLYSLIFAWGTCSENSVRNPFCRLGVSLLNQMRVDILRGTDLCVSQTFGNTDRICTGEIQHRCHTVAELVRVDMREVIFLLKSA